MALNAIAIKAARPDQPRPPGSGSAPHTPSVRGRARQDWYWLLVGVVAWVASAQFLWLARNWIFREAVAVGLVIGALGWIAAVAVKRLVKRPED